MSREIRALEVKRGFGKRGMIRGGSKRTLRALGRRKQRVLRKRPSIKRSQDVAKLSFARAYLMGRRTGMRTAPGKYRRRPRFGFYKSAPDLAFL